MAPWVEEALPAAQGVQLLVPGTLQKPRGQHTAALELLYSPAAQGAATAAPPTHEVPAEQKLPLTSVDPVKQADPGDAAQGMGAAEPPLQKVPAAQMVPDELLAPPEQE
jgi:hypothetical protein